MPITFPNRYRNAQFLISAAQLQQLPPDSGREVAFAGRSNAGKSSALNAITDNKTLARTSKTPGRTQLLNYFEVDGERRLVDLPGYGFAKVPMEVKRKWEQLLASYLQRRESLRGLVIIMDIRHPLTPHDRVMLDWCRDSGVPAHVLLTKADKLRRGPAGNTLQQVRRQLKEEYPLATVQIFSATARTGVDEARAQLDHWLGFGETD